MLKKGIKFRNWPATVPNRVVFRHINLHGEYDFAAAKLEDSVGLEVPKIRQLEVG